MVFIKEKFINNSFDTLNLDNIEIISSTIEETGEKLFYLINSSNKQNLIVTFNLDFYRNTEIYPEFKSACQNADFVFPDGTGITKLLKLKYGNNVKRITGNELFEIFLLKANESGLRLALVGSTVETLNKLSGIIRNKFPGINICAAISPPMNFELQHEYNIKIIGELKEAKPDILLLALGSPRQELWLYENKDKIGAKINMGVGATFDFYSGSLKRSPVFLQRVGLEWFWRLLTEPGRLFKRYIINDIPFFIKKIFQLLLAK